MFWAVDAAVIATITKYQAMQKEYEAYLACLPTGEMPKTFEQFFPIVAYEREQAEHQKQLELAEAGRARNWLETLLGR